MTDSGGRRQIVVSTDGHCGADLWDYKPYLESRYHEAFDPWAESFHDAWADDLDQDRDVDRRSGLASAVSPLNWDSALRDGVLDGEGIAAEVLFPNTPPPFYPSGVLTSPGPRSREEWELRFAGLRAHNRWLVDFCRESPDRRAGLVQIFLDDIDAAIAEVRWGKEHGLRGVLLPADHVQRMAGLYYPEYEPLWAVCAELGMPLHRHAAAPTESFYEGGKASQLVHFAEIQFYSSRAISHLIFAGVFERYPQLTFVTTEIALATDIVAQLAKLDMLAQLKHLGAGTPFYEHVIDALSDLRRLPSEYYATNCFVAGPHDVREAIEAGLPNVMWGADIPHSEGTFPHTVEALRATVAGLPPEEVDDALSRRAVDLYQLDANRLQAIADRVGPTVEELQRPLRADEVPSFPEETRCSVFRSVSTRERQAVG